METKKTLQAALKPFVLVRLYSHLGEEQPSIERFNVSGFPTMVILGSDDREIDRIVGWAQPEVLAEHIGKILRGDTFEQWLAGYRAQSEHSPEAVEECLRKLTRRGLYGQAVAEAEHGGLGNLSQEMRHLVLSARLKAFSMLYQEVADRARTGGWTGLDMPEDPAGEAGVGLVKLVFKSQHHHLEDGEALRRALCEARSTDANRMVLSLLENLQDWKSRTELLRFARRNGCKGAVMFLVKSVTFRGVDRLDKSEQISDLLQALITIQGAPDLEDRLAERLLSLRSDVDDLVLAAQARYLAGRRKLAAENMSQAQRRWVRHGFLRGAHWLGEQRRAMANGTWSPPQPWIANWPKP